jgi:hypothetical protein
MNKGKEQAIFLSETKRLTDVNSLTAQLLVDIALTLITTHADIRQLILAL